MTTPFLVPRPATSTGAASDNTERELALDITRSWVVEAPAGSGKTGLIIQRYLKLLADPAVTAPEQVLAITFTNKAAAELRERIVAQLESASLAEPSAREFDRLTRPLAEAVLARSQALGWELLEQSDRINIRTIDSVCSLIARSLPILSGSGGALAPSTDAAPLYALAARRTFLELGGTDHRLHQALHTILLHRDGQLRDAEALLAEMLCWREQWGELIPLTRTELDEEYLDSVVLPSLQRALEDSIQSTLDRLASAIPESILRSICSLASDLAQLPGYKDAPSPVAHFANRTAPLQATIEDLPCWRCLHHLLIAPSSGEWRRSLNANHIGIAFDAKDKQHGRHKQQLAALLDELRTNDELHRVLTQVDQLPPAEYPEEQWRVTKALFHVLSRALAELQLVFAERSECDFTELALAARTALSDHHGSSDLTAALGVDLQHLLVDEMQDTSAGQYDLIERLTHTWDGHSQTLLLVGDPKQSIYLFRQARVERFLRVLDTCQLGDLPLGRLALTANFRSQARLVEAFNSDFVAIFNDASSSIETAVPYSAANPRRSPAPEADTRIWHRTLVPNRDSGSPHTLAAQRIADAEAIRTILEKWRSRPLPEGRSDPWKLAVLVRNRTHLKEIIAALQRPSPIPYRAIDIEPLKDRREVKDVLALTRALLHPCDRVAWLAILRAPWCGLTLRDLHLLTGEDDPAWAERSPMALLVERGHLLSPDGIARLERIWPPLQAAINARARMPLAELVERTWRSLGGDAYANAAESANVLRYLQTLNELERAHQGFLDAANIERSLKHLYAASTAAPDAVDLLTIHAAKGLEWDLVCVPALERGSGRNRTRLLNWIELDSPQEQSAHILLAPIAGRGKDSHQLNRWLDSMQQQREAAERRRLFYVASTRAREALHLFASPEENTKGEPKIVPGSLLEIADREPAKHFAAPPATAAIGLVLIPATTQTEDGALSEYPLTLAASATNEDAQDGQPLLYRLPISFDPIGRLHTLTPSVPLARETPTAVAPRTEAFIRPEGSFAARAFGNTVHALLELLAAAPDQQPQSASAESLSSWLPRITALLRAEGLPPASIPPLADRVLQAMQATLADPVGRWILAAHPGAEVEYALSTSQATDIATVRMDRTFLAGSEPLAAGSDHRWIIDYKTRPVDSIRQSQHNLEEELAAERLKYQKQLDTYARYIRAARKQDSEATPQPIRLGLYYPQLQKLIWWPFEEQE